MQDPAAAPSNLPTGTSSAAASSKNPARTAARVLSAVEIGAEKGFGPLSPLGLKVWHGESYPCVSCGQLVRRSAIVCDQCGQDLSLKMIMKMQTHAGPWYVLEHVRPFPGVTLDRLVRQAQRGVLTATTIVRGPTTYHQWRFAAETPALSKHLGLCWNCQAQVTAQDTHCPACKFNLDEPLGGEPAANATSARQSPPQPRTPAVAPGRARSSAASAVPEINEVERIRAALTTSRPADQLRRPRGLPVTLIIAAIVVIAIIALLFVVRQRQRAHVPTPAAATRSATQDAPGAVPVPTAAAGTLPPADGSADQPPADDPEGE